MKNNQAGKISLFILLLIYVSSIYARWIHLTPNPIIYDVFGYYLYLPFTFIYNDLGLQHKEILDQLISQYNLTSGFYQAVQGPVGYWVMKYSMGMAVYYSPGFFVAHIIALLTDYPADGFSEPYQWALIINSTLFEFLGLLILRKVLLRFFSDGITSILLALIFLGTNYYAWSTTSAEMPHSYLFTMYALVLWLTIRWHDNYKPKYLIFLSFVISSMALARPTEIIAIVIPLLWNIYNKESIAKKITLFKSKWRQILWFGLIMFLVASAQMIYWKLYSGSFIFFSYTNHGEGFEFLNPYTIKVLTSFRNGWLIYTPIMLFAITGLYYLYKANIKIFVAIFMFFIINLYIVSSWSCWWYAGGLGHRAFVQSYALMSLPLGYFIQYIYRKSLAIKIVVSIIISLLVMLNLFQAWQLRHSILSQDGMTFKYYVNSFLKTEVDYNKKAELCLIDRSKIKSFQNEEQYKKTLLKSFDFEQNTMDPECYSDSVFYDGTFSYKIDSTIEYYTILKLPYRNLTTYDHAWIRLSMYVYIDEGFINNSVILASTFLHKGKGYQYVSIDIEELRNNGEIKPRTWNRIKLDYLTPEVRSTNDELMIHIWNKNKITFYIDDITIELFEPIPK